MGVLCGLNQQLSFTSYNRSTLLINSEEQSENDAIENVTSKKLKMSTHL